ncbi:MAG TPA: RHS repeat-associated core domain-containing protein [Flavipsychrobacter sp.]|nr:RHS repeat-associated core domain-containing protein [Flavipsychrobacter sp.]
MTNIHRALSSFRYLRSQKLLTIVISLLWFHIDATGQTFDFPSVLYVDSASLRDIVTTPGADTVTVKQGDYNSMWNATTASGFTIKSILALTNFKVNVQSPFVGQKHDFTYLITYKTIGTPNPASPGSTVTSAIDTLSVSYNQDSLKLISDRAFNVAGKYHKLMVIIYDVFELTNSGSGPVYTHLVPTMASTVPTFVNVFGEIYVQKFVTASSLNITSSVNATNNINVNGTVHLDWGGGSMANLKPAGYEVEWTYVGPATASVPYSSLKYNFRNNATRIFTNNTNFNIPVAQKEGYLVYRVRMVRPDLNDLLSRNYGPWTIGSDAGNLNSIANVAIQQSANDSLNWDLKMSFVEDGKYKEVVTYYDGLLKPKQVQTRFNSKPSQTIVAQSLFDYEGRAVINSLPIPVDNVSKFAYISNFLHPVGATEYAKSLYDSIPDTSQCPPRETAIPPLDSNALSNKYYSRYNANKTGKNAFIPDAEGYPLVRKIIAPENSEKVLFEGQAGSALQLGHDRQMAYLYGSPLQAELNRYFGQDIGKANYYRKMITTDNHQQDMFTITDDEGRTVASGLIGTPDTNSLALSVRNAPVNSNFQSNLLPVPNIRLSDDWKNNGSYFVEANANYSFKYQIDYKPFKPCPNINQGLKPKVYFSYEVIDNCGNVKVQDSGVLGGTGMTSLTSLSYSQTASAFLNKGNHIWNKHSYIKTEDLEASVDTFLNLTNGCFRTFNDFLKDEFLKTNFPCVSNDDPCASMKYAMMKEMYPRAKYGQYAYADTVSKTFGGPADNSIFSRDRKEEYRYQSDCITYPDTIYYMGSKYYNIKQLSPQQLIDIFNDSIAEALLPLHPDYCKLQLCGLINNPYAKALTYIKKASQADSISRYAVTDIITNDPLYTNSLLTFADLSKTMDGDHPIDSIAFKKTICGSEFGVIESVCSQINAGKTPADIVNYPEYMRDEYYQNLINLYVSNREERLSKKLQEMGNTCGPCDSLRLIDPSEDTSIAEGSDTTFLVSGVDTMTTHLHLPVHSSFGNYFDPVQSGNINLDSVQDLANLDNSIYCTTVVDNIITTLSSCNVSQTVLDNLKDTLLSRFCSNNGKIAYLSYDSLTSIFAEVGIATNDLCNAGLVDLRRITRESGDYVQLGLLHYSPAYYQDLVAFLQNKQILSFIAGSSSTINVSLSLCDVHPFEQNIAKQLGATLTPTNCGTTFSIQITKTSLINSNAVKLSFIKNSLQVGYYLYPASDTGDNALNTDFGTTAISSPQDYKLTSLFNLYGFDKVSKSFANRNTILLSFKGTKDNVQSDFGYFLSAFNEQSDYNLMEKDQKDYLNGIGCSEFIPMAKDVLTMAQQLNIKAGHPYFEDFFTNVLNYKNAVNFSFDNYQAALESCGLTDSIIIQKDIAHFKIKFPSGTSLTTLENYVNTLTVTDTIGVSDIQAYQLGSYKYLLLKVFETNGLTIKDIKQLVQAALPGGSTMQYMPYLHKDTIAQLLSNNLNPVNISSLTAAFPGATITNTTASLFYIIPGYGTFTHAGRCITIVKSIASNYDYNHYLDSVCRFVHINAPMTVIYSHAESAVSAQYNDWQMKAWRNYVNSLTSSNHNELVKKSKAPQFNSLSASSGSYSFANSAFSYVNARRPYYLNNLYIDHEPTSNPEYSYIQQLLTHLQSYNQSTFLKNTIFKPTLSSYIPNLNVASTETRAYICGDTTTFWINHFDTSNEMINIFIKLPDYLPLPRESYHIVSISKGFEEDSVTYFNLSMAAQGSFADTIDCIAYTNRNLGATYTIPSAFLSSHSDLETVTDKFENCETRTIENLYPAARINYNHYIDSMRTALVVQFRQDIIDSLHEDLSIIGNDIKHGITLYYYDMAGNLIKTVSPAGVKQLSVAGADNDTINAYRLRNEKINPLVPGHDKVTWYRYNAQNKVIENESPDGGRTVSQYDLTGRVVVSQDARQRLNHDYTYFLYDNLSRVIETGIVNKPTGWPQSVSTSPGSLMSSQIKNSYRKEVTVTIYDTASYKIVAPFQTLPAQENLKNRVTCTKYFDALGPGVDGSKDTSYANALHYSYDIAGNVKTLVHDLRTVLDPLLRFKRVDYEYDLYSGKVMMVSYNRGHADQFYQKYTYDSDNRIVEVYTSNNGIKWDRDAHYDYYDHGPLARTELGEQRVQGVDYAYTINGWMKAVNGVQNDPQADMGEDGATGVVMPKDVFSQRIDYFAGDYKAISDSNFFRELPATPKALYNGNIAAIARALAPFNNIYNKYHYDPLQRIDHTSYEDYSYNYGTSVLSRANIPDYATEYKYDADGNLLKLTREGGTVSAAMNGGTAIAEHNMDLLTYRYAPGTNQLRNLTDSSSSTAYKIDIPQLTDTSIVRYTYDPTGNTTKDLVSGLSSIEWNRFGKVKSVAKVDGTKISFSYDPLGNRLAKEVVTYPNADSMVKLKTVYLRDAAGNSLAVYEDKKQFDLEKLTPQLVAADPDFGFTGGPLPISYTDAIAHELWTAYELNGEDNLATLALAIPSLEDYSANAALLQDLVGSLSQQQALGFVKSIPSITSYTLTGNADGLTSEKLSYYLESILLSVHLDDLQTQLFTKLKERNSELYYATVESIPVSQDDKDNFPDNQHMLTVYKSMRTADKLSITNSLASSLTSEYGEVLPPLSSVLVTAFSNDNSYGEFVSDVPDADRIFDQLKSDAGDYIGYRYALADQGTVPLDSVKVQFKYNTVLADALSAQTIAGGANSLSLVLSEHFSDVVNLAATSNKSASLVSAIKGTISAIDMDVLSSKWLATQSILQSDRVNLAEHHIYGSSRLGMQKYLPDLLKYEYGPAITGSPYQSLIQAKPWYSLYGNDLFSSTVYNNSLSTSNMSTSGIGINTHVLGNRHYELTNHLGNVQATVLDRTTPVLGGVENTQLLGYHADISTAQDYYPFGMLMPGRYISDTDKHCVTINSTVLVSTPITASAAGLDAAGVAYTYEGEPTPPPVWQLPIADDFEHEVLYLFHYIPAEEHPEGWVLHTNAEGGSVTYTVDLSSEPSGITSYFQLHPDTSQSEQQFGFGMELNEECQVEMRVRQYYNSNEGEYYEPIKWTTIRTGGDQNFVLPVDKNAVKAGGKTILELKYSSSNGDNFAQNIQVSVLTPWMHYYQIVPETRVVTICDEKDNYRFGFNGKEKDNEPKGIGNSLDFGARIYDSRLGRWLSIDPQVEDMPWQSPYQFASNSPIYKLDPDGNWDVEIHSFKNRGKMSYGIAILKNRNGEEIARYVVRVAGSSGVGKGYSGSDSRTRSNGDTPTGTYDIDNNNPWWRNSTSQKAAYGNSYRLAMTGEKGEIMQASKERQNTIRMHAGRQEIGNGHDFDPKNKLKFTNGCVRMYQEDLDQMRASTVNLQNNDGEERPGVTTIDDDLIESDGKYYTPQDYKTLADAKNKLKLIKSFSSYLGQFGKTLESGYQQNVTAAEKKGLNPKEHQN